MQQAPSSPSLAVSSFDASPEAESLSSPSSEREYDLNPSEHADDLMPPAPTAIVASPSSDALEETFPSEAPSNVSSTTTTPLSTDEAALDEPTTSTGEEIQTVPPKPSDSPSADLFSQPSEPTHQQSNDDEFADWSTSEAQGEFEGDIGPTEDLFGTPEPQISAEHQSAFEADEFDPSSETAAPVESNTPLFTGTLEPHSDFPSTEADLFSVAKDSFTDYGAATPSIPIDGQELEHQSDARNPSIDEDSVQRIADSEPAHDASGASLVQVSTLQDSAELHDVHEPETTVSSLPTDEASPQQLTDSELDQTVPETATISSSTMRDSAELPEADVDVASGTSPSPSESLPNLEAAPTATPEPFDAENVAEFATQSEEIAAEPIDLREPSNKDEDETDENDEDKLHSADHIEEQQTEVESQAEPTQPEIPSQDDTTVEQPTLPTSDTEASSAEISTADDSELQVDVDDGAVGDQVAKSEEEFIGTDLVDFRSDEDLFESSTSQINETEPEDLFASASVDKQDDGEDAWATNESFDQPDSGGADDFADWTTSGKDADEWGTGDADDDDFADFGDFQTGAEDPFPSSDASDPPPSAPTPVKPAEAPKAAESATVGLLRGSKTAVIAKIAALLSPLNSAHLDISTSQHQETGSSLESLASGAQKSSWQAKDSKRSPKPLFRGTFFETNFLAALGKQPLPSPDQDLSSFIKRTPTFSKRSDSTSGLPAVPFALTPSQSQTFNPSALSDSTGLAPEISPLKTDDKSLAAAPPASFDLSLFGAAPTTASPVTAIKDAGDWMSSFMTPSSTPTPTSTSTVPIASTSIEVTISAPLPSLPSLTPQVQDDSVKDIPIDLMKQESTHDGARADEPVDEIGMVLADLLKSMPDLSFMHETSIIASSRRI